MNILLTGATGYIGKRLLPKLLSEGHQVYCCVRDKSRFTLPQVYADQVNIVEVDFLKPETTAGIPHEIDVAYFLIHSMSSSSDGFDQLEKEAAQNFAAALQKTSVEQVIYLSGIVNDEELSRHLKSRKLVEKILSEAPGFHTTTLRAGIIVGSGSASFEIIRDLVEKLPIMVAPKWLKTKCQPIAVRDVIQYLTKVMKLPETYDSSFDIGGPEVMTYKEMLYQFAEVRGLKRKIITVPVMTPRLSSYWLYFVTSTSYKLATALVDSMKVNVICEKDGIDEITGLQPITYKEALRYAFKKIDDNHIVSSWKDSLVSGRLDQNISQYINVPTFGCFKDHTELKVKSSTRTLEKLWLIGGETGWYYGTSLWKLRGYIDKLFGGVGLRRGRSHPTEIHTGDTLDFWRVLYADKNEMRLLLYAEMRVPGEAWLEFKITEGELHQTATFRPKGLLGRLYWFAVYPLHGLVFKNMARRLAA